MAKRSLNSRRNNNRKGSSSGRDGIKQKNPLLSNVIFQILLGLIGLALFVSTWLFIRLESMDGHTTSSSSSITSSDTSNSSSLLKSFIRPSSSKQQQLQQQRPQPHLYPRLPYLPTFPSIENKEDLIRQTIYENQPTIAGIGAILYHFLDELHTSNLHFANITSKNKKGNTKQNQDSANNIRVAYNKLVSQHLLPLEAAYRGRSVFPIRNDDSVFVSIAAFREHLLADTLKSAFSSATNPNKLFVGVIVNNCFDGTTCQKSPKVVGKDKNGKDVIEHIDGQPDTNHIDTFCSNITYQQYCESGQVRVLYINEVDALGPAVARYYSSKLWGGETYYVQVDSHLHFADGWDELYIKDLKLTSSHPKAVLSTYPPGFVNFRQSPPYTRGTRLCRCQIRSNEDYLPRVEMEGRCNENETRPTQMPFMGAGFFFARSEFLIDIPFDPFLPWLFMGEEVALSIRAWTNGWNIYAPRINLIGHQYRPLKMGTPHFWETIGRFFHQQKIMDRMTPYIHNRIKYMMGYPKLTMDDITKNQQQQHGEDEMYYNPLLELEHYGLGNIRSREDYLKFAEIDLDKSTCGSLKWCSEGELE